MGLRNIIEVCVLECRVTGEHSLSTSGGSLRSCHQPCPLHNVQNCSVPLEASCFQKMDCLHAYDAQGVSGVRESESGRRSY